jgi:hypothetical protein
MKLGLYSITYQGVWIEDRPDNRATIDRVR